MTTEQHDASREPRVPEEALAALFAECLQVPSVGPDDDFFVLGGYSLTATTLSARVRSALGVEVTTADIFRNPTVRSLRDALGSGRERARLIRPADRGAPIPASFAQERLWILDQFTGPSSLYNVAMVLRLDGPLDQAALRRALGDVLERHEALRTRVVLGEDGPVQEALPAPREAPLHHTRVTAGTAVAAVREAADRSFCLATEIPFRAELFAYDTRAGDSGTDDSGSYDDRADDGGAYVLLLLIHHIAVDGWSNNRLTRDIGLAYSARLAGRDVPWQPLPVQYADYAVWQRAQYAPDRLSPTALRQTEFWRSALAGAPEPLVMTTDRPRPPVPSGSGDHLPLVLGPALHRELQSTARRSGCTVFVLVHAALALLLHLRGAGEDVVIGATVAGRPDASLDELVGLFVNTLVLRVDLSGAPTVDEVVRRAQAVDLAAMEHQDLPFDRVVEAVNPVRSAAYGPLVQVLLAFQAGAVEPPEMTGLRAEAEILPLKVAKFDLTWELTEAFDSDGGPAGVTGHLEYAEDLFDRDTARAMVGDLGVILRVITREPDRPIHDLPCGRTAFAGNSGDL
ncbi:condensation domain-containing protein [Streptomyces sp. NRRL B-1347]|uniref:condensation domain-containing protein n=1 Tax=Streptomyces sp. NRRL B-1347 TaxID=1476877 RepID=UPI0004CC6F4F|nr:condensation domain-containing protein [Streptomyces sp. NRRL B-1347]